MPLPEWIRTETRSSARHSAKNLLRKYKLSTVCEEARCPNQGVCFSKPVATFMILGDYCTRRCGFCAVKGGVPSEPDPEEPQRVAGAVAEMGLRYVVITSVTRDDLPDGGAAHFAVTVRAIRKRNPDTGVEVLTPDFKGDRAALRTVLDSEPVVFNHNVETVERLYGSVRPQAEYKRSLLLLRSAKEIAPRARTKSGLMLGLGETTDEVVALFRNLRDAGCDFLTLGQYLRPSKRNLPVVEYVLPAVFEDLKERALDLGFEFVASGPLVRSSMNAEEMYTTVRPVGRQCQ